MRLALGVQGLHDDAGAEAGTAEADEIMRHRAQERRRIGQGCLARRVAQVDKSSVGRFYTCQVGDVQAAQFLDQRVRVRQR